MVIQLFILTVESKLWFLFVGPDELKVGKASHPDNLQPLQASHEFSSLLIGFRYKQLSHHEDHYPSCGMYAEAILIEHRPAFSTNVITRTGLRKRQVLGQVIELEKDW